MNTIMTAMKKTIMTTVREVATKRSISDVDGFVADVMLVLEMPTKKEKVLTVKTESIKSEGGKKRVVSKKMKESFMTLPGSSAEKLEEVIKAYKIAADVTSFDDFARSQLGVPPVEAKPKKEKVKKEKKEKSGRMDKWTPTSTKLFKTIVEDNGGVMGDDMKKEFVTWLDVLSDEEFADASIQGHMRSFVMTKIEKKEEVKEEVVGGEDEELEEFDFEGEKLLKGEKSGKIYRPTEEAGDVLIGYAGKGRFASVSK